MIGWSHIASLITTVLGLPATCISLNQSQLSEATPNPGCSYRAPAKTAFRWTYSQKIVKRTASLFWLVPLANRLVFGVTSHFFRVEVVVVFCRRRGFWHQYHADSGEAEGVVRNSRPMALLTFCIWWVRLPEVPEHCQSLNKPHLHSSDEADWLCFCVVNF